MFLDFAIIQIDYFISNENEKRKKNDDKWISEVCLVKKK